MKKIFSISSLFLLALVVSGCGNNPAVKKVLYNVRFLNLDGSEICSSTYERGHTIVPPDDILDYDVPSECHRYCFLGFYDGTTAFQIGTKATANVTYQAKFLVKDKHEFDSVTYTWGTDSANEDKCTAKAVCSRCKTNVTETGWSLQEMDKQTPCFNEFHYSAFFETIGFEEQYSPLKREVLDEHSFTKNWAKDYIGNSGKYYCDKCGDLYEGSVVPKSTPSQVSEVNFAFDKFGATATLLSNSGAYKDDDKVLSKAFNYDLKNPGSLYIDSYPAEEFCIGYAEIKIELPRVKYSLYSTVSYDIEFEDATYGVTFKERTWIEPGTEGSIQGNFVNTKLEITYNSLTNAYDAALKYNGITLNRDAALETSIVNGTKSLVICVNSMFFRGINLTNLVLVNK